MVVVAIFLLNVCTHRNMLEDEHRFLWIEFKRFITMWSYEKGRDSSTIQCKTLAPIINRSILGAYVKIGKTCFNLLFKGFKKLWRKTANRDLKRRSCRLYRHAISLKKKKKQGFNIGLPIFNHLHVIFIICTVKQPDLRDTLSADKSILSYFTDKRTV